MNEFCNAPHAASLQGKTIKLSVTVAIWLKSVLNHDAMIRCHQIMAEKGANTAAQVPVPIKTIDSINEMLSGCPVRRRLYEKPSRRSLSKTQLCSSDNALK